ncbi:MAG: OsmC family peroxiredoxin [Spartobacteria bacterium]|nr:OsmC family peroxiredoxin [Spartobacteria bacterium]
MKEVIVSSKENLQNEIKYADDAVPFIGDEPASAGGEGAGPDPYTLLLAALGTCTSITLKLYARRKGWPLDRVIVRLSAERIHSTDAADCGERDNCYIHKIRRELALEGDLTDDQRARLKQIATRCPIHQTLTSKIVIADAPAAP